MSSLSRIVLESTCDLLDRRVLMGWPTCGWSDPPNPHFGGPMGFERLTPHEHRAGFDTATAKFRILALETFRFAKASLKVNAERTASEVTSTWDTTCLVEEVQPSRHILLLPRSPPLGEAGEAHLVGLSYQAHTDGCAIELRYYLDPAGLDENSAEEVRGFVRRLAESSSSHPPTGWSSGSWSPSGTSLWSKSCDGSTATTPCSWTTLAMSSRTARRWRCSSPS